MSIVVEPQWKREREELKQKKQSDHDKILKEVQAEINKFKKGLQEKEQQYETLLSEMGDSVNQFNELVKQQAERYQKEVETWQLEKKEIDELRTQEKARLKKTNELLELAKAKEYQLFKEAENNRKRQELDLILAYNALPQKQKDFIDKAIVGKDDALLPELDKMTLEDIRDLSGVPPEQLEKWRVLWKKYKEKQREK